jgi:hypothetical protein
LLNKINFNKDEVTSYNVEVIASSPHIEITKILYNYGFNISGKRILKNISLDSIEYLVFKGCETNLDNQLQEGSEEIIKQLWR